MLEVHIKYEGVEALCDRLASDLNKGAVKGIMADFVQEMVANFYTERFDGGHDIFECVAVPTLRAGVFNLCIRFSPAFYAYTTSAAKDRRGWVGH